MGARLALSLLNGLHLARNGFSSVEIRDK